MYLDDVVDSRDVIGWQPRYATRVELGEDRPPTTEMGITRVTDVKGKKRMNILITRPVGEKKASRRDGCIQGQMELLSN